MEPAKKSKQWRKQNKINKIKALLDISRLNKKDREKIDAFRSQSKVSVKVEMLESSGNESDCSDPTLSYEPASKLIKLEKGDQHPSVEPKQEDSNDDDADRPKLSETELAELRNLLKERRKVLRRQVKLHLKEPSGIKASLDVPPVDRVPLFFSDIQHLLLYFILRRDTPFFPRWCACERIGSLSTVRILFIEGAGISDYLQFKNYLPSVSESSFPLQLEVVMPSAYEGDMLEEFCSVPLTRSQGERLAKWHGTLSKAAKLKRFEVFKVLRTVFPINSNKSDTKTEVNHSKSSAKEEKVHCLEEDKSIEFHNTESLPPSDKFPRTTLLLSAWQMVEEGYPIPLSGALKERYKNFVPTKPSYKEVNNFSPMYAVDCEMCMTTIGQNECTRVSIVNEKFETVLDTLVLPHNKITNYLTRYSGITPEMMKDVTTRLEDVQKWVQENLEPDAILVGQSLNFDLVALKMMHPYCIDTSVIFNVTGDRYRKTKLKILTEQFLGEAIQTGKDGHCSVEDSSASLKLVQLKLSKSIEYGDLVLSGIPVHAETEEKKPREKLDLSGFATSIFNYTSNSRKHVAIMSSPEILKKYKKYINPKIQADDANCTKSLNTGQVSCIIESSNEAVVERISTQAENVSLSVGHIQLSEHEGHALSDGDSDIIGRLDNWISCVQKSAPINCVTLVLLCGKEKSSNGVCFLNVHKPPVERLQFKP